MKFYLLLLHTLLNLIIRISFFLDDCFSLYIKYSRFIFTIFLFLPVSLYMEWHDLLYPLDMQNGNYVIEPSTLPISTRQSSKRELVVSQTRLRKYNENYPSHASLLYNLFIRQMGRTGTEIDKNSLTEVCWQ